MYKSKSGDWGSLSYKKLNVLDALDLLADIGLDITDTDESLKSAQEQSGLKILTKIIRNMGPFITDIKCEIEGFSFSDYETCLNHRKIVLGPLAEIAAEYLNAAHGQIAEEKKSSSSKQSRSSTPAKRGRPRKNSTNQ